jgi:hypothetical protein
MRTEGRDELTVLRWFFQTGADAASHRRKDWHVTRIRCAESVDFFYARSGYDQPGSIYATVLSSECADVDLNNDLLLFFTIPNDFGNQTASFLKYDISDTLGVSAGSEIYILLSRVWAARLNEYLLRINFVAT